MNKAESSSRKTEREIFLEALERSTPEEQLAFLDEACAHDPSLRAAVETLLQHHIEDHFLESPSVDLPAASELRKGPSGTHIDAVVGERPGDRIGNYKLLQQIGEGGVGVVYMAEQEAPVQRRVALKVLKAGMDTKSVIARFESEQQALALMEHPNIAKVLDAGSTAGGRPFFVMELVRGVHVTDYCGQNRLSTRDRLGLVIQICQAIQHAHQKGIIHRDIKPSNILVTLHDGVPVPKVIDFGIAKATDQRLTDKTLFTEFQSFIGTPAYISPEQAEMSGLDVDTRADIYSLGVLLYELLVGRTPFDAGELRASGLDGMRRMIREREPTAPSTRLRMLPEAERTTTAECQRAEPARLTSVLRGDLDWIVLKALEKDRARRYATAHDLALDIRRYLDNEPILARPPSRGYRFRKLVRRNRLAFVGVGAFVAALLMGLTLSTWQYLEKGAAYQRVLKAEREQSQLREEAEAARRTADSQALVARGQAYAADMNLAQQALAVNNLGRAKELLNRHRPEAAAGRHDRGSEKIAAMEPSSDDLRGWEWRYLWRQCQSDALFTLCQLSNEISGLSVSADGNWVAVGEYNGNGISIWDLRARQEIARFPSRDAGGAFAFSPVSPMLAFCANELSDREQSGRSRSQVQLWNAMTRRFVGEFPAPDNCRVLEFSSDGAELLGIGTGGQVSICSVARGIALTNFTVARPKAPERRALFGGLLAVSKDFHYMAQAVGDGGVRVVDLNTRAQLWSHTVVEEYVTALSFSPDGTQLATAGGFVESKVRLWAVADGRELARLEGHRTYVRSLEFWPDGETLASASGDQTIHLWNVGHLKAQFPSRASLREASPTSAQEHPYRWEEPLITELHPETTLRGHQLEVWSLALCPDNATLVSGCKDGSVCVWDTTALRRDQAHVTLPAPLLAWRFMSNPESILGLDEGGRVARWHGPDFQQSQALLELGVTPSIACFSADGQFLALASPRGATQIWDLRERRLLREIEFGDGREWPVAFLERSHHLVTQRGPGGDFREWDVAAGRAIREWRLDVGGRPWKSAVSPSGRWMIGLKDQGVARLLQPTTGLETEIAFHLEQVSGVAFSPDDRWFAAVSVLGVGHLWDLETGRQITTLQGFLQGAHSVAFSPDGRRLAIGSNGSEAVKLWDLGSLQELLTLKGQGSMFSSIRFSPDGDGLASRNSEGVLHVWRAPSFAEIAREESLDR